MRGKNIKLSLARRTIVDLAHFSRDTTKVTIARRLDVSPLLLAVRLSNRKISLVSAFIRAFGLITVERPELRRVFLNWPLAHLHEYPNSVAAIAIERIHKGERILLFGKVYGPETGRLHDVEKRLQLLKTSPLEELWDFRLVMKVARWPQPVRRMLWRVALNVGWMRPPVFGTFAFSSVAKYDSDIEYFVQPVGFLLTCGPISSEETMTVRLSFDHRVIDGADVARALTHFEAVLNGQVASEVLDALSQT